MRPCLAAALVCALSACGRVAYDRRGVGQDSGPSRDAHGALDAAAPTDAASPPRCPDPDTEVVALYRFERAAPTRDEAGAHEALVQGGTLGTTTGPSGCGEALAFPTEPGPILVIPDSPDWDLPQGSVDFWVRFDIDASDGFVGIATRDADGNNDGHFSVFRVQDGTVVARLQSATEAAYQCATAPSPERAWTHVGVNFGPDGFELWVDGEPAMRTGDVVFDSPTITPRTAGCGTSLPIGLAGNDNPWILGVNGARTAEGETSPLLGEWFRQGAIDHFRVSRVRRDFAAYTSF